MRAGRGWTHPGVDPQPKELGQEAGGNQLSAQVEVAAGRSELGREVGCGSETPVFSLGIVVCALPVCLRGIL